MLRWIVVGLIGTLVAGSGWWPANPVQAQADDYCASSAVEVIKLDSSTTNTLDDAWPVRGYCLEGQAGDEITVTVFAISGDLDPQVGISDVSLEETLAVNYDISPTNRNAELTYTLPSDGRYVIAVGRNGIEGGTTSGDFVLAVQLRSTAPTTPMPPTATPDVETDLLNVCESPLSVGITYDDRQRGLVDDLHAGAAYCFNGQADEVVLIEAVAASGDLDTLIYLADPFYETIYAQNDDRERGDSDSAIVDFVLPADGQYLVVVTRFGENSGQTSGEFNLTVSTREAVPPSEPSVTIAEEACPDPIVNSLSANAWQSLLDTTVTLRFFCDGSMVWQDGALRHEGIYRSQAGVLLITLTDTGDTFVWGDVLIVDGFFMGMALDTNEEVYFVETDG